MWPWPQSTVGPKYGTMLAMPASTPQRAAFGMPSARNASQVATPTIEHTRATVRRYREIV